MKRFTGHEEKWGNFVDVRTNIADVAKRQLQSPRLARGRLYIGTVTDPYQSAEARYDELVKSLNLVTPAEAGVQKCLKLVDSGSSPE